MQNLNFGFHGIVGELFKWLENYGYYLTSESSTLVKYKGPLGYVNIYYGRSSYEIGVEVGPPEEEKASNYSMSELIRLMNHEEAQKYRNPIATSLETMKTFLSDQAQRLRIYGKRILTGDNKVWQDLQQQRQTWSEEYAMDILQSQIWPEAENSFRKKNFKRVVELLSRIEHRLSPSERKKLEYSKRKLHE